ncbi:PKD domain-containing protein, partial [Vibrio thalassae]
MKYSNFFSRLSIVLLMIFCKSALAIDPVSELVEVDEPVQYSVTVPELTDEDVKNGIHGKGAVTSIKPEQWQFVTINEEEWAVWRAEIHSPGAKYLNLGFTSYIMPVGGTLHIYTPDKKEGMPVYTHFDNDDHGELWISAIEGDTAIIELNIPAYHLDSSSRTPRSADDTHDFHLTSVIVEVEGRVKPPVVFQEACLIDVACPEGDDWRDQIRSTVQLAIPHQDPSCTSKSCGLNLLYKCSGTLINNTKRDGRPLILTASHCEITEKNAHRVTVSYNYQASTCGTGAEISPGHTNHGVKVLASNIGLDGTKPIDLANDYLLLELEDPINPNANAFLVGWNGNNEQPTIGANISHPKGRPKSIAIPREVLLSQDIESDNDEDLAIYVKFAKGVSFEGSSGSGLLDKQKRLIGVDSSGEYEIYDHVCAGKEMVERYVTLSRLFDKSWSGPDYKSYLDPIASGDLSLDGMNLLSVPEDDVYVTKVGSNISYNYPRGQENGLSSLEWDFDDGSYSSEHNSEHTFKKPGLHEVSLTLTNNEGDDFSASFDTYVLDKNSRLYNGEEIRPKATGKNRRILYFIDVPANVSDLTVTTQRGRHDIDETDIDLTLSNTTGSILNHPSGCKNRSKPGSNKQCDVSRPVSGTWYVMLQGEYGIDNVKLKVEYTLPNLDENCIRLFENPNYHGLSQD